MPYFIIGLTLNPSPKERDFADNILKMKYDIYSFHLEIFFYPFLLFSLRLRAFARHSSIWHQSYPPSYRYKKPRYHAS